MPLRHAKPISNYRVNYIADVVEKVDISQDKTNVITLIFNNFSIKKLNSKPRRPLTMAFQKSEYKNEFEAIEPEVTYEFDRPLHSGPQDYFLKDELTSGPTKVSFN